MKEKIKENLIKEFESKIKEYEDILFGMNLYYQGICFTWGFNKEIIEFNRIHYKSIEERMTTAINKAKQLLEEARRSPDKLSLLQWFEFPPIKEHPVLDEGTKLAKALAEAYREIFPERPRNKPLTEEESQHLKIAASKKI